MNLVGVRTLLRSSMNLVDVRTLLRSTLPVAGILLFWGVIGQLLPLSAATTGARIGGILMATLYVVAIATPRHVHTIESVEHTGIRGVALENIRVAVAASSWFLVAFANWILLVPFANNGWYGRLITTVAREGITLATYAFVGTGVLTVVLYVVSASSAYVGTHETDSYYSSTAPKSND